MRLRRSRTETYYHKKRIVEKDREGSTRESYGTASSVEGESWPASGKVQAQQYGERLNYIRNVRISGKYEVKPDELELELAGKITSTTFSKSGIQTQVPSVDGVPIIATPSNRMYSAIKINDGKTSGQESGGYVKGETAKNLNFFICPMSTPIAVTKQDIMRIFDPATNQRMNAWQMDYRRFHDIWVLDNKLDSIYLSIQEAE